jgi:hypothetical protein
MPDDRLNDVRNHGSLRFFPSLSEPFGPILQGFQHLRFRQLNLCNLAQFLLHDHQLRIQFLLLL